MVPLHRGQRIPERNYRRPGSDRGGRLFWNTTVPRTVRRRLARHGIADRLPQSVVGRCRPAYRRGVQAAGTALYDARMSRLGDGGRPVDQTGTGDAPSGMEPDGRHVRGQQRNAARPAAERRGVAGVTAMWRSSLSRPRRTTPGNRWNRRTSGATEQATGKNS